MNRNTKEKWVNSFKINPYGTHLSNLTLQQLVDDHGYQRQQLEGRRPDNSKVQKDFVTFHSLRMGEQAEIFLRQNKDFLDFSEEVDQHGLTRFNNYKLTLARHVRDMWDIIRSSGSFWYDPSHAQADSDDGFLRAVEALFMKWSDDNQPRTSMATKILKFTWKGESTHGTLYPPDVFKLRLQTLWKFHDMLPENGPEVSDDHILRAVWDGLPDAAQDYITYNLREDPFDSENDGADAWEWSDLFDYLQAWWNDNCREKYYAYEDKKRKRDDDDGDDRRNKGPKRQRNGRRNGRGGGNRNDGNERNNDRANGGGKTNFFNEKCSIHQNSNHLWKDCIFCPTGEKFKADRAKQLYESSDCPGWYKKTYKRRIIDGKGNRNPKQQQQQQQQQQFFVQPTQQQGTYMSLPAATVSTQPQALPPVPSYFQQAPAQPVPTFATGTTSSASSLTASAATSQQQPLYQLRTDAASGKQYFSQVL